MPRLLLAAFGLAFIPALAACTPSGTDMNSEASAAAGDKQARPDYRRNPQPRQAYRITVTIKHAPGPFAHIVGLAQFDVRDRSCLPPPDENDGHLWPMPTAPSEFPLERTAENTYTGVMYADQMLDEDYYGRGTCHWEMIQAQVHMKATGGEGETLFAARIPREKILAGKGETTWFNKVSYPRLESSPLEEPTTFGQTDRSRFGPSIPDEDLFTVTLTARKEAPHDDH